MTGPVKGSKVLAMSYDRELHQAQCEEEMRKAYGESGEEPESYCSCGYPKYLDEAYCEECEALAYHEMRWEMETER